MVLLEGASFSYGRGTPVLSGSKGRSRRLADSISGEGCGCGVWGVPRHRWPLSNLSLIISNEREGGECLDTDGSAPLCAARGAPAARRGVRFVPASGIAIRVWRSGVGIGGV